MTAPRLFSIQTTCAAVLGLALSLGAHAAEPAAVADPCQGAPRCYNAGSFIAEVTQVSPTAMGPGVRHHTVSFTIRFRNVSNKPVILAYRSGSSAGLDNFGSGFTWGRPGTHDTSVKGIGMVVGNSVDTQFSLAPGQSRNATFGLIRFNAKPPIGEAWNYDVVIEEIEIQPGQMVRSVRQNSVSFTNLRPGTFPGVAGGPAGGPAPGDAVETANRVLDLFDRMKKK
jgi:hypothetical protein